MIIRQTPGDYVMLTGQVPDVSPACITGTGHVPVLVPHTHREVIDHGHGSKQRPYRSELVSKCRHESKFYLSRFVLSVTGRNNYQSTYIVTRVSSSLGVLPPPASQQLYTTTISFLSLLNACIITSEESHMN